MFKQSTKKIARAGIIAGLYVILSLLTLPISNGAIQVRIAEGLTLLPLLFPESMVSIFVGCFLTNILTGCAILDAVLGAFITLLAGALTFAVGSIIKKQTLKVVLGGLFPVVINALLLPLIWYFCYGKLEQVYVIQALLIFAGQAVAVYGVGVPMYLTTKTLIKN